MNNTISYPQDLIILTAGAQSFSILTTWFWLLLLLAPLRGFLMLWTNVIAPWIFQPAPEEDEISDKKQKKMDRKMKRSMRWVRETELYVTFPDFRLLNKKMTITVEMYEKDFELFEFSTHSIQQNYWVNIYSYKFASSTITFYTRAVTNLVKSTLHTIQFNQLLNFKLCSQGSPQPSSRPWPENGTCKVVSVR